MNIFFINLYENLEKIGAIKVIIDISEIFLPDDISTNKYKEQFIDMVKDHIRNNVANMGNIWRNIVDYLPYCMGISITFSPAFNNTYGCIVPLTDKTSSQAPVADCIVLASDELPQNKDYTRENIVGDIVLLTREYGEFKWRDALNI